MKGTKSDPAIKVQLPEVPKGLVDDIGPRPPKREFQDGPLEPIEFEELPDPDPDPESGPVGGYPVLPEEPTPPGGYPVLPENGGSPDSSADSSAEDEVLYYVILQPDNQQYGTPAGQTDAGGKAGAFAGGFAEGVAMGIAVRGGLYVIGAIFGGPVTAVVGAGLLVYGLYELSTGGAEALAEAGTRIATGQGTEEDYETAGAVLGGIIGGVRGRSNATLKPSPHKQRRLKSPEPHSPHRDFTGRIHDPVPKSVPKDWGRGQIEDAIFELERSIPARRAQLRPGSGFDAHLKRIKDEEKFLRKLRGRLRQIEAGERHRRR